MRNVTALPSFWIPFSFDVPVQSWSYVRQYLLLNHHEKWEHKPFILAHKMPHSSKLAVAGMSFSFRAVPLHFIL